ncbi:MULTISPECIES: hypothetical protein [Streptomyces]
MKSVTRTEPAGQPPRTSRPGTSAGWRARTTVGLDRLPTGPWAGIGVLAAYAGAALVAGGAVLGLRDA